MKSKFCGIIGTAYCGSTMFSYIMGSSKDIFSTGELVLGYERYRCANIWHRGDWTRDTLSPAEQKMTPVRKQDCDFWTESFAKELKFGGNESRNILLKRQAIEKMGKKIVLNPDKAPKWYKKSLEAGDEVDNLIILFKKPEAYCFSFEVHKRGQGGKWEGKSRMDRIQAACQIYVRFYREAFQIIEKYNIPAIFLNYEDFAKSPHSKTELICKSLDAEYNSNMIEYWNNRDKLHLSPSGNRGAHIQFLKFEEYVNYWKERMGPNSKDNSYFEEHADWFLANYHKITLDEKYKKYLSEEEVSTIRDNTEVIEMYTKMMGLRI